MKQPAENIGKATTFYPRNRVMLLCVYRSRNFLVLISQQSQEPDQSVSAKCERTESSDLGRDVWQVSPRYVAARATRRVVRALAMSRPDILPSTLCTASAPGMRLFRGSMAGLCAPLSTLRQSPRGLRRMTRGRCGSLLLHRKGLAPSTPCRSPGASHNESAYAPNCGR
jgi:hypothetical protein